MGVPDGARVVLYAPTWRDDRTEMVDYVDLATFASGLGDDHVLLVRGHSRTLRYGQDLAGDRLIDVTSFPEHDGPAAARRRAGDRLLLGDVRFRGHRASRSSSSPPTSRTTAPTCAGFYFDLLAEAPGPVVHERAELRDAILAADAGAARDRAARGSRRRRGERASPRTTTGEQASVSCSGMLDAGWLAER